MCEILKTCISITIIPPVFFWLRKILLLYLIQEKIQSYIYPFGWHLKIHQVISCSSLFSHCLAYFLQHTCLASFPAASRVLTLPQPRQGRQSEDRLLYIRYVLATI